MDKIVLEFLHKLKENNNRDWFNANKDQYEKARQEAEHFVDHLILEMQKIDKNIGTLTSKQTMFRIYRDVRFSKDKSPYKTYFGAFIAPGGRKSTKAGYYIHIAPEGTFVGGGAYHPMGEQLKKIRSEIYYNLAEFEKITSNKQFKNVFGELKGDRLVRPPQGFPKDFDGIELLKFKDYTVFFTLSDKEVLKPDFMNVVKNAFKTMKPLNDFLNRAMTT
jgi:uncharacterized protein (TIGR02453 family)